MIFHGFCEFCTFYFAIDFFFVLKSSLELNNGKSLKKKVEKQKD